MVKTKKSWTKPEVRRVELTDDVLELFAGRAKFAPERDASQPAKLPVVREAECKRQMSWLFANVAPHA